VLLRLKHWVSCSKVNGRLSCVSRIILWVLN